MPTSFEFSVKLNKSGKKVTVKTLRPASTDDPEWENKIAGDVDAGVNALAFMDWKIKVQAPMREAKDEAGAQSVCDRYKYGAKGGGVAAPTLSKADQEEGEFTPEQLEIIRRIGTRTE